MIASPAIIGAMFVRPKTRAVTLTIQLPCDAVLDRLYIARPSMRTLVEQIEIANRPALFAPAPAALFSAGLFANEGHVPLSTAVCAGQCVRVTMRNRRALGRPRIVHTARGRVVTRWVYEPGPSRRHGAFQIALRATVYQHGAPWTKGAVGTHARARP